MAAGVHYPRAVVFDLDGTLVDSAPEIARALSAAFARYEVPPFPAEAVHGFIGAGAAVAIQRAAAASGLALGDADVAALTEHFFAVYREVSAEGRGLYPGAHDALSILQAGGCRLGLCTNKAEDVNVIAVRALGIGHYFGAVAGARDGRPKKPHPAMLHAVLAELGVAPADAVMVGDSGIDLVAARAAGLQSILVSFGYSRVPVRTLGADGVVDALAELPAALAALTRARA